MAKYKTLQDQKISIVENNNLNGSIIIIHV